MRDGLRDYLKRQGVKLTPADPAAVAAYERSMREDFLPKLERDLREQRRLAHYFRLGIEPPGAAWTCPKCGRVWGPTITQCEPCNSKGPFGTTRPKTRIAR